MSVFIYLSQTCGTVSLETAERRVAELEAALQVPPVKSKIAVRPSMVEMHLNGLKGSLGRGTERARSLLAKLVGPITLKRDGDRLVAELRGNLSALLEFDEELYNRGAGSPVRPFPTTLPCPSWPEWFARTRPQNVQSRVRGLPVRSAGTAAIVRKARATATNQVPNASALAMAYFKDVPKSHILASAQEVLVLRMLVLATRIAPGRVAPPAGSMATNETRKDRASAADE